MDLSISIEGMKFFTCQWALNGVDLCPHNKINEKLFQPLLELKIG